MRLAVGRTIGSGAGDVAGVWVGEFGIERLSDDGLDGRELESGVPSGEPSGVKTAGRSSLAVVLLVNWPVRFRRRGTCCRWIRWAVL